MTDTLTRFNPVLEGRKAKGMKDVMALFGDLTKSDKYTPDEKPVCFAVLIDTVSRLASTKDAHKLLETIRKHGAMAHVPATQKEEVAARLVRLAMSSAAPHDGETQYRITQALIAAGVAGDRGEVFSLALFSQMSYDDLDTICDVTEVIRLQEAQKLN